MIRETDYKNCEIWKTKEDFSSCSLDVIVLSFNGLETSKDFLKFFLLNTPHDNVRLIWVDNGSSDGTRKFLQKTFDEVVENGVLILSNTNLGVIEGRNLGFDVSNFINGEEPPCEKLMFLDNDQFVGEGWLEHHLAVLDQGYDLVGVEAWQLSDSFMPVLHIKRLNQFFHYVGCGGMVIKREVTDEIGMFDTRFSPAYFEDPDFCLRSVESGFKIGWNIKAKIVHMPHRTLGQIDSNKKHKILLSSLFKFREKWKGKRLPVMRQKHLEVFSSLQER
jgi:O-antigen biosynthesis protein